MAIKALSSNDEAIDEIFRVNIDDPQPGDIKYIDKLIRMKVASDSVLEILKKLKDAFVEHAKRETVVQMTSEAVLVATVAQNSHDEGVKAVAEGLETLDRITEDPTNPQNAQDTNIVRDALTEIAGEVRKVGEYAQKAVDTCKKYENKANLSEFSLEDIKKDLDEMKENTHKVQTSQIRIQNSSKKIKEVRERRGIHSDIQQKNTDIENSRINKDYNADALTFFKDQGIADPSNIQALSATANHLNQGAQKQLEDSQNALERLRTQLERAQSEAMATAKGAKHSFDKLFTAPAVPMENGARLAP